MECSICGISGEKTRLLDVISPKEIVKVCEACSRAEDMPVLKRPTTFQLKEAEKKSRIYPVEPKKEPEKTETEAKTEITLKEIADRNYERKISQEKKPRPDLVDNFHWVVMRARRLKKLTQEQLAKEILESTAAIKMAEEGILPEDDYRLVNKLESFLGIRIIKDEAKAKAQAMKIQEQPARILKFDKETMKDLTISDLKEMKDKTEEPEEEKPEEKTKEEAEVL